MDYLQELIEQLKHAPEKILWVVIIYLVYKLFMATSIFTLLYKAVIFAVNTWRDVRMKDMDLKIEQEVNSKGSQLLDIIDRECISSDAHKMITLLSNLKGLYYSDNNSSYVHGHDIEKAIEIIGDYRKERGDR